MWRGLHILIVGGLAMSLASALGENLLPFGGFEAGSRGDRPAEFWHRAGNDYFSAYPDWKLASDGPAAGRLCVTTTSEREFVACGECGGGKVTGSLMLRASGPAKVRLRLSWWNRLSRTNEMREVDVGPAWQRFDIQTDARSAGPIELAMASKTPSVQLWADEFQVQGSPPADQMANATYRVDASKRPDLAAQMAKLQAYDGPGQDSVGQVPLRLDVPPEAVPLPTVSGGVPFPKGKLFRPERVRVLDAAGREMPCQVEVLARWHADRSVKMLLVTVPAPSASAQMTLVFGPDVSRQSPSASPPLALDTKNAALEATDGEGRVYRGRVLATQTERSGPLVSVTAVRGELRSEDGKRLGRYVTRYTAFRSSSLVHIAHCWINDGPEVVRPVRSAAFDILAKPRAPEPTVTQVRTAKSWAVGRGDQPVPASEPPTPRRHDGVLARRLAVRDFAENHPLALAAPDRGYRVWLWPETVRGVLLPQGFARQWEFLFDTASASLTRPYRTQSLPVLRAEATWMCASGVFEFLLPPDAQTFPIFEQRVGSTPTLGRFAWQEKERGNLFGVFNYGDGPGDGGWANLESMADHELFLHWMRTTSREHFDMARLAAEHYRDVDIHHGAGFAHTHGNNHTASGEGWSHSWIQGVRDLYLLLGDFRALEVLHELGECLLTKDIGWATGRDWTRAIDDLVDIHGATGDPRFLDCVLKHVAELGRRQDAEKAVCGAEKGSWYEDRYQAGCAFTWYGCQAMAKLHYETGDPKVLDVLRKEIDLSLDVQTKSLRSHVILPDEKLSEDHQAETLANPYALGRGSTLFPALGYLAAATGDRRYVDFGMKILAHYMLNLRGGSDNSATSYATVFLHYAKQAGIGPKDEAAAFQRARDFSFEQWPKGLVNGGFEADACAGWQVKKIPGEDFYHDDLVKVGYYLDDKVKRSGKRSLRLHSDNRGRPVPVRGSFGLKPMTRWRASVWVKADPSLSPGASLSLREYDTDVSASHALRPTGKRDGDWEERAAEFATASRTVATWTFGHTWSFDSTDDARNAWFDDAAIEELGPVEFLLTNNGGGRNWRKPGYGALNVDVGGFYTPDEPMTGDAKVEGAAVPFTLGCLTDGVSKYDHLQKPLGSYCYWPKRDTGALTFKLGKPCSIRRVRVNVLIDSTRKSHGTAQIELSSAGKPLGLISPAQDGWNEFANLNIQTDTLTLKLTRLPDRPYLTLSEVEIWGYPDEKK